MNLLEEIGNAGSVAIAGHIRPDGDCISSTLALRGYLKNAKPNLKITVFTQDNPPKIFSYLDGYDEMNLTYSPKEKYDVFVALDVSSLDRLGESLWFFENADKTICVDHHETNPGLADVNEVRPKASSTCEVLFDLFEKEYIDDKVAEALFTGIVHDSGVFLRLSVDAKYFLIKPSALRSPSSV